jgi:hypothetical protein
MNLKLLEDLLNGSAKLNGVTITSKGEINMTVKKSSRGIEVRFQEPRPNVSIKYILNIGGPLHYIILKDNKAFVKVSMFPEQEIEVNLDDQ